MSRRFAYAGRRGIGGRGQVQKQSNHSAGPRKLRKDVPACIEGDASAWRDRLSEVFVELDFVQASPKDQLTALVYEYAFGDLTFIRTVVEGGKHRVRRSQALIKKSPHNVFFIA